MPVLPRSKAIGSLGHSADVNLLLHSNGRTFSLSHTCSTALRLADDVAVPIGPARVEIITDGISHYSDITILGPENGDSRWLKIQLLSADSVPSPE